jgi:hypothetical protein
MAAEPTGIPESTELIYLPEPSWKPVLLAFGIGLLVAGTFMGWVWAACGAIGFLLAMRGWIADTRADLARLPRRQSVTTAAIPATPLRAAARRSSTDS